MSDDIQKSFLGSGWSFPPRFSDSTRGIVMSQDEEDIRESLNILLSTLPGERIMNPSYGCDIHSQAFQSINNATRIRIQDLITTAILYHEPRIRLISVDVDESEQLRGRVNVNVVYEIKGVNARNNMVYPFYLAEGTEL
ncbi:phage baseplate assembly protein W [Saprospira grandis DSM 2844]|uniref:Phage baseplate assembly protein W n=1 Tax=Saprospira grandis DSM 2844 TaxID=694433 RepID=J1I1V1_9BACT|nr:GPW/gp25 family protein [Saprospira grandis]EJF52635.1 phage baseplate assembly protein W [Saprospira grandis DSM 2844]